MTIGREEQRRVIKEMTQSQKYSKNDKCYAVSMDWWRRWQKWVGWSNISFSHESDFESPGEIDNTSLLNRLTESRRGHAYEAVSEGVWSRLTEWYGGGPEIQIGVVMKEEMVYEPESLFLFLRVTCGNERKRVLASESTMLPEFAAAIRRVFGIEDGVSFKIFCALEDSRPIREMSSGYVLKQIDTTQPTRIVVEFESKNEEAEVKQSGTIDDILKVPRGRPSGDFRLPSIHDGFMPRPLGTSLGESQPVIMLGTDDIRSPSAELELELYEDADSTEPAPFPGVVGLRNIGNTCYFNSGVQCLVHTRALMKYFLLKNWTSELNTANPIGMHGEIAQAFGDLVSKIWSGESKYICPRELKAVMGRFASQFAGSSQQDAHELVTFMMDGIHEDLNRCKNKPAVKSVVGDGTNDQEIAAQAWMNHKLRNDSIIVDLFHGQLRSELLCPLCHKTTVVFDPYMCLPLPIQPPKSRTFVVTFIPYDVCTESSRLNIMLHKKGDINKAISEQIGRDVHVVIMTWRPEVLDGGYQFGLPEEDAMSKIIFAIEIPDPKKQYVIGRIRSDRADLTGPIAVEVDDMTNLASISHGFTHKFSAVSGEELEKAHDISTFELSQLRRSLVDGTDISIEWKEGQVFHVAFRASYGFMPASEGADPIGPDAKYPFVLNSVVHAYVNPEIVNERWMRICWVLDKSRKIGRANLVRDDTEVSLDQCLGYFSHPEELDEDNEWFCPQCRSFVMAKKTMNIWTVPKVLIIQLRRFIGAREIQSRKLNMLVRFPKTLDISHFIMGPMNDNEHWYRLYAVCEHHGGLGGGHYTAHAKVSSKDQDSDGTWYYFNDSNVSEAEPKDIHSSSAYLLFYEQV